MLSETTKQEIQNAYRTFLKKKSLRPRAGQRQMIAFIANALGKIQWNDSGERTSGPSVTLIEAGTGTGKTLGYALSAIPVAKSLDKRLIISTATVALQEQVVFRDLPDFQKNTDIDFSFALAKGRRRYACLSKLDAVLQSSVNSGLSLDFFSEKPGGGGEKPDDMYETLLEAFTRGDWDGDRDTWKDAIEENRWQAITATHAQCTNRKCSYFRQCPFFSARAGIGKTDVIVTNHDLVLSDLRLGGGSILPSPEQCIYIFDEGHHLPAKTLEHFARSTRLRESRNWLEQVAKQSERILVKNPLPEPLSGWMETLREECRALVPCIRQMEQALEEITRFSSHDSPENGRNRVYRFAHGTVPESVMTQASLLESKYGRCFSVADEVTECLKKAMDGHVAGLESFLAESLLPHMASMAYRFAISRELWGVYAQKDADNLPPHARWIEHREHSSGEEISVNSSMIEAGTVLNEQLWSKAAASVVTSATLTALGSFTYFRQCAGISDDADSVCMASPFDYANSARLTIPAMDSDPGNSSEHTLEIIELMPELLKRFRATLVLFASRKQMWEVFKGMERKVSSRILLQDQYTKSELLKLHRERVEENKKSVIFGLASLAEGIDLPGRFCEHVIIAKIPFQVPDDPVEASRAEWLTANGGNPFMDIAVPEASIRLIQSTGRLLRHEDDRGEITILDTRLLTRRYGKALLNALPPYEKNYALRQFGNAI